MFIFLHLFHEPFKSLAFEFYQRIKRHPLLIGLCLRTLLPIKNNKDAVTRDSYSSFFCLVHDYLAGDELTPKITNYIIEKKDLILIIQSSFKKTFFSPFSCACMCKNLAGVIRGSSWFWKRPCVKIGDAITSAYIARN